MMSLAKGLGGGLPIGAMLARGKIAEHLNVGSHGTTFGGNPLSCAVALAVLDYLTTPAHQKEILARCEYFESELRKNFSSHPRVADVRGRGMMMAVEFKEDVAPIFQALREEKILVTQIKPKSLRILPPLIAGKSEVDRFVAGLQKVLQA
jgi:acetylornithine aminotransferase